MGGIVVGRAASLGGRVARQSLGALKRGLRARGWELRRTDPDRSLGEHLWLLFPYLGVNCVLDVGAGSGAYGQFLRQNGYTGWIISFEPVAAAFQQLASRAARDPRWRALPYALGDEHADRCINVTRNPGYASFLRPAKATQARFEGCIVERTETVEVRRLDTVFDDVVRGTADPRVFLKLTTQGWDPHVLRGAADRLDQILGLHTELSLHPVYEEAAELGPAIEALNRTGFGVSGLFDRPHHHGFRLSEVDCVMVRQPDGPEPLLRRW
jgi:FkbM family methyltransferase